MTMLKFWLALLGAVLAAIVPGLTPLGDGVTIVEVANVVVLGAGAVTVFVAPNIPSFPYVKTVAVVVSGVGVAFISFYGDGVLDASETVQLVLAALMALGVYAAPNAGTAGGVVVAGRHALAA